MILRLIRHSETELNKEKRFQGMIEVPLSEHGKEILRSSGSKPEKVYVSGLSRTHQTAEIIFPGAELICVADFNEIGLGILEGKNHEELKDDPEYKAWLERGGEGRVPGGEDREHFACRVCGAFKEIIRSNSDEDEITAVVHGGTIMAGLLGYDVRGKGEYLEYLPANGEGYEIEVTAGGDDMKWRIIRNISYRKDHGFTHLYYGLGRGKTSIAMGTALRALENGYKVIIFQMCKEEGSSETLFLSKNGARVYYGLNEPVFPKHMNEDQNAAALILQNQILTQIMGELRSCEGDGTKKLLVLDEACAALQYGVIDEDILWDAVIRKPFDTEIIMTGRRPASWMKDAADYMTELTCNAHPLEKGIVARKGIDK